VQDLRAPRGKASQEHSLRSVEIKATNNNERDSIGLAVSEVNSCNYWPAVHSFTDERVPSCRPVKSFSLGSATPATRSETQPSSLRAKSSRHRGNVSDADLKAVRDAGYAKESIMESEVVES
jgi:hypothetical protein